MDTSPVYPPRRLFYVNCITYILPYEPYIRKPFLIRLADFFHILDRFDLYQDNIIPNLLYITERYDIFFFPPENTAEAAGSRYDQMGDAAGADVKLHIPYIPKALTITDIDDFFFFKSKIRIVHTSLFLSVVYAYRSPSDPFARLYYFKIRFLSLLPEQPGLLCGRKSPPSRSDKNRCSY